MQHDPAIAGAQMVLPLPPLPDGSPAPPRSAERHANLVKFQSELECLANPLYLYELHTQSYLSKPAFLAYIDYLQYWHEPEYARFITYPTCLVYLSLLQKESFREAVGNPAWVGEMMRVGARHHETWRVDTAAARPAPSGSAVKQEDTAQDDSATGKTNASGTGYANGGSISAANEASGLESAGPAAAKMEAQA